MRVVTRYQGKDMAPPTEFIPALARYSGINRLDFNNVNLNLNGKITYVDENQLVCILPHGTLSEFKNFHTPSHFIEYKGHSDNDLHIRLTTALSKGVDITKVSRGETSIDVHTLDTDNILVTLTGYEITSEVFEDFIEVLSGVDTHPLEESINNSAPVVKVNLTKLNTLLHTNS